jgi:hypothetical protein
MAIVTSENFIKPTEITHCKRTFVESKGKATAQDANDTTAMKEAVREAFQQRDLADAKVHALTCPQGECDGVCRRSRKDENTGSANDRTLAKKVKLPGGITVWEVDAWATNSWYVHCKCGE